MGPLALLALAGGIGGLASIMKEKGIDLKKKKPSKDQIKKVAKDVLKKKKKKGFDLKKKDIAKKIVKKKKKKYVPEWQTKPDTKKIKEQQERSKKNRKRFLDKLQDFMN